jgi:ribosome-associated protein
MAKTKETLQFIIEGLQEKKGKNITIVDLTSIEDTVCDYMVIGEGNSTTQVSALADSVWDFVRKKGGEKPVHSAGENVCEWIAMDYADVIVHIFLPERREFYNIENLWADAKLTHLPDID